MTMESVTDHIRNTCRISRKKGPEDITDGEYFKAHQRERILKRLSDSDLPSFEGVRKVMMDCGPNRGVSDRELQNRTRDLMAIASECLGSRLRDPFTVSCAAALLLQMHHDTQFVNKILGTDYDLRGQLLTLFDSRNLTSDLMHRAYDQCHFLLDLMRDHEDFSFLFSSDLPPMGSPYEGVTPEGVAPLLNSEWGQELSLGWKMHVDFIPTIHQELEFLDFKPSTMEVKKVEETSNSKTLSAFSLSYKPPEEEKESPDSGGDEADDEFEGQPRGLRWLFTMIQQSGAADMMGLSTEDVTEMVKSTIIDSDNQLEENLVSLLGLNNLRLVSEIITNKETIMSSLLQTTSHITDDNGTDVDVSSFMRAMKNKDRRGKNIIVQTEEEKRANKAVRKVEKKMRQETKAFHEGKQGGMNLMDLERMRQARAAQLLKAMNAPLFSNNQPTYEAPKYPFVFDSFSEAKQTASFVNGNKLMLPAGFIRKEEDKMEEMIIPAPSPPPAEVISAFPLIKVNTMDDIGQLGFQGFDRLNQIQSIVFETAYGTNENMLICAPTGAGKTNIAMLTVLNEVNNNMKENDGKIRLSTIKVIYIAPMKALASEMVDTFGRRLKPFNMRVKECTGDMQLTRAEIAVTNMIVTTPEKFDVITRKPSGIELLSQVNLVIVDEVHLLESDRGPVLEALVARIKRHVESTGLRCRLVGLSATLPNYVDVAQFLAVSLDKGMFMFDNRFRPVPLEISFVGVKPFGNQCQQTMDQIMYDKVKKLVIDGHQVMVFVHSRAATYKCAQHVMRESSHKGESGLFVSDKVDISIKGSSRMRSQELNEILPRGFAIHHAGLIRNDRNIVEQLFKDGAISILFCTSTLAWGVNLPAHAVIIRGTEMYDPAVGTMVDVSMLDIMQIFGRAGRPQYDTSGYACIITPHEKLSHYLSMLTNQFPIESKFFKFMTDNMNAEIASRSVQDINDAIMWLRYTYLFVRMTKNPLNYGMSFEESLNDPQLNNKLYQLCFTSAVDLKKAKMIHFDEDKGDLRITDLGRCASHFYIKFDTIEIFNTKLNENMDVEQFLQMLCLAGEFEQLKCREEEMDELYDLRNSCRLKVNDIMDACDTKANILLQSYISGRFIKSSSLVMDSMYIATNAVRLLRGLFDYVRRAQWAWLAEEVLYMSKMVERKQWKFQSPFRQLAKEQGLDNETLNKLDRAYQHGKVTTEKIRDKLKEEEINVLVQCHGKGKVIKRLVSTFPFIRTDVQIMLVNKSVVRVELTVIPDFKWNGFYHGTSQSFWLWLFDPESYYMYESSFFIVTKQMCQEKKPETISFSLPIHEGTSSIALYVDSAYWFGSNQTVTVKIT